jgi:hypothetical protein
MRNIFVLCLLTISFSAFGSELPENILLKNATQSFTDEFEVSILDGRLWYRPLSKTDAVLRKWQLVGKTGLPVDSALHITGPGEFDSLKSVTEISADGDNLIAIGNDGYVYYMKWSTHKWVNKWGKPVSGKLRLPKNIRSWSISHRGPFAGGYNDIDGNFHPIFAGVTTLYTLSDDGLNIYYADPWLPPDFSHQICGPLRNRFRARSLNASASTIFVISDTGEMYTRIADYDTMGNNPFLDYSYERKVRDIPKEKDVRTLPPEEWKKQPSISKLQGQISSAITIIQTGKGNDSRELRAEGVNAQGAHGFFSKSINSEIWSFTKTNLPLQKPLLPPDGGASDLGPDAEQTFSGHIKIERLLKTDEYKAELINFNPPCSGSSLVIKVGDDELEFPFYTTASSHISRKMEGAFTITDEIKAKMLKNKMLEIFVKNLFGEKSFVEIKLIIDESGVIRAQSHSFFSIFLNVKMEFAKGI